LTKEGVLGDAFFVSPDRDAEPSSKGLFG